MFLKCRYCSLEWELKIIKGNLIKCLTFSYNDSLHAEGVSATYRKN